MMKFPYLQQLSHTGISGLPGLPQAQCGLLTAAVHETTEVLCKRNDSS
jgi:hypothetical protein